MQRKNREKYGRLWLGGGSCVCVLVHNDDDDVVEDENGQMACLVHLPHANDPFDDDDDLVV